MTHRSARRFLTFFDNRTHLTSVSGTRSQSLFKKPIFSADVAVQTEAVALNYDSTLYTLGGRPDSHDDQESTLSAADLASILKWSKDISRDINLSSGFDLYQVFKHFI